MRFEPIDLEPKNLGTEPKLLENDSRATCWRMLAPPNGTVNEILCFVACRVESRTERPGSIRLGVTSGHGPRKSRPRVCHFLDLKSPLNL